MRCKKCTATAVSENPVLCKKHFLEHVEEVVHHTLVSRRLVRKAEKIGVALSGGKDSITLLYLLNKFHRNVEAIAIDEGIHGYREKTLEDAKKFCRKHRIRMSIHSFRKEFGFSLDQRLTKKDRPCSVCGILRRNVLNKYAHAFDRLATGHNMDDEAQAILMNLLRFNWEALPRGGPKPGIIRDEAFVPRIKPLYFLTEKQVALYALLMGFGVGFAECPNARLSYRAFVRDLLNEYESQHPGTKEKLVQFYLVLQSKLKTKVSSAPLSHCLRCGMPSKGDYCAACQTARVVVN